MRPVRAFLRGRLDVSTPFEPDELADAIPVDLNSLEVWQVGDHLLREVLAGQDPVTVMTAEQLADRLPPGVLGHKSLAGRDQGVPAALDAHRRAPRGRRPAPSTSTSTSAAGAGSPGRCTGVYGNRVVSLGYSRLKPRQRLQTWVDVLALAAHARRRRAGPATPSAASAPGRSAP